MSPPNDPVAWAWLRTTLKKDNRHKYVIQSDKIPIRYCDKSAIARIKQLFTD